MVSERSGDSKHVCTAHPRAFSRAIIFIALSRVPARACACSCRARLHTRACATSRVCYLARVPTRARAFPCDTLKIKENRDATPQGVVLQGGTSLLNISKKAPPSGRHAEGSGGDAMIVTQGGHAGAGCGCHAASVTACGGPFPVISKTPCTSATTPGSVASLLLGSFAAHACLCAHCLCLLKPPTTTYSLRGQCVCLSGACAKNLLTAWSVVVRPSPP